MFKTFNVYLPVIRSVSSVHKRYLYANRHPKAGVFVHENTYIYALVLLVVYFCFIYELAKTHMYLHFVF